MPVIIIIITSIKSNIYIVYLFTQQISKKNYFRKKLLFYNHKIVKKIVSQIDNKDYEEENKQLILFHTLLLTEDIFFSKHP